MKISVISTGDKVAGTANTTVVCYLHPSQKEMLNFSSRLEKIKIYFSHPSSQNPLNLGFMDPSLGHLLRSCLVKSTDSQQKGKEHRGKTHKESLNLAHIFSIHILPENLATWLYLPTRETEKYNLICVLRQKREQIQVPRQQCLPQSVVCVAFLSLVEHTHSPSKGVKAKPHPAPAVGLMSRSSRQCAVLSIKSDGISLGLNTWDCAPPPTLHTPNIWDDFS